MMTLRQIERLWQSKSYDRLFRDLISARPESSLRAQIQLAQPSSTAALGLIRLYELNQEHTPLYAALLRHLIANQSTDGGWSDPLTTSLCLRALLLHRSFGRSPLGCEGPSGTCIDSALSYLATLQKSEGIWPNVPIRRMPADPYVSAFLLYRLAEFPQFRSAVRFFDALNWFDFHQREFDAETRTLWDRAATRCRLGNHGAQLTHLA